MTPEQEIELNTWWILRQLKKAKMLERVYWSGLVLRKDTPFEIHPTSNEPSPSYENQYKILVGLARDEVILFRELSSIPSAWLNRDVAAPLDIELEERRHNKMQKYEYISIEFAEKFDDVYAEFEKKFTQKEKKDGGITSESDSFYHFQLSKEGVLSRKLGEISEQYPMVRGSIRHKIIIVLNSHRGRRNFHATENLAEELTTTNEKIRAAVGNIRVQIEKDFQGIQGNEFIEGKRKSGYRLGLKIRLLET